jgi:putative ABC transport system ATP-binding protein
MTAIRAERLEKSYGAKQTLVRALDDVSLSIEPGKIVALLGPSGSGKSTLVKTIGLVTVAERGRVWIDEQLVVNDASVLVDLRHVRRRKLGYVFQRSNLIPFLTARQNVEIAAEIAGQPRPRKQAEEILGHLGLGDRLDALPSTLSGGQQQRVAIARALVHSPKLILADEPTAALDSVRGRTVMELFRRIAHERGAAVLVVTHDHRTLEFFDELHHMEDGRLSRHADA